MTDSRHYLASLWDDPRLAESLSSRPGVGKSRAQALAAKNLHNLSDALWWLPVAYEDRRLRLNLSEAPLNQFSLFKLRLLTSRAYGPGGKFWRMNFTDSEGTDLTALWFSFRRIYLQRFREGAEYFVAGRLLRDKKNNFTVTHPKLYEPEAADNAGVGEIWPVYPQVPGISGGWLRGFITAIARDMAALAPDLLERSALLPVSVYPLPLAKALLTLHCPEQIDNEEFLRARQSLIGDELFYFELALSLRNKERASRPASVVLSGQGFFPERMRQFLPFSLSASQEKALGEIAADMARPYPMFRLLSADVGAGKTVVALAAAAMAAEAGSLALFMSPTEILARQHYASALNLLQPLGINIGLVLGGQKGNMINGGSGAKGDDWQQGLIVGTSALLWREKWENAGLVIIDEQHRFGVEQRLRLGGSAACDRSCDPHVLILSATPIPRTLHQALSGFLDISGLSHHSPQRQPINTVLLRQEERAQAFTALKQCLREGGQAYVVCPALHPTEKGWDVLTTHQRFLKAFPDIEIGLLHGQMKSADQVKTLECFQAGQTPLLISTTVVEVGLDVPGAVFMLILSAEYFGLSQLHQLRGRVGRGDKPGQCWLLAGEKASDTALERLAVLRDHLDGLVIAEADLNLRGPGETLGYRQSGLPAFRIANWSEPRDARLLAAIKEIIAQLDLCGPAAAPLVNEAKRRYG
ncbi:MAG: DEAD/DEAH box helicase [Desulfarculales bacterium]|jgi:ATP-dependent DNA helicase RecG|nr:DEAD/DEAH box helicase [Desulfarculales bacterium]